MSQGIWNALPATGRTVGRPRSSSTTSVRTHSRAETAPLPRKRTGIA